MSPAGTDQFMLINNLILPINSQSPPILPPIVLLKFPDENLSMAKKMYMRNKDAQ